MAKAESTQFDITCENLWHRLGRPDTPMLIDVCTAPDFDADPMLIPTATRRPHTEVATISGLTRDMEIVTICQKGLKLSRGAAAWLRARGHNAISLRGGNEAWKAAGLPRTPAANLPEPGDSHLWVGSRDLSGTEIAAAWLVRRFVSRAAEIFWVPPSDLAAVSERFNAERLDAGEDQKSPLLVLMGKYGLDCAALEQFRSAIERDAMLKCLAAALRGTYKRDDAILEAGLVLCDTLFEAVRNGLAR